MLPGVVEFGDRTFVWLSGLLSGWLWTAVFGTLINIAVIRSAARIYGIFTGTPPELLNVIGQGDDGSMWSISHKQVFGVIEVLGWLGWKFNIGKFWVSKTKTEFLRFVYTSSSIRGYPVRAIGSLLWSSPASDPWFRDDRINAKLDSWVILLSRTFRDQRVYDWMVGDMAGLIKTTPQHVIAWLNLPSAVGGAGVFPDQPLNSGPTFTFVPAERQPYPTLTTTIQAPSQCLPFIPRELKWRGVKLVPTRMSNGVAKFEPNYHYGRRLLSALTGKATRVPAPIYTWDSYVWGSAFLSYLISEKAWPTILSNLRFQVKQQGERIFATKSRTIFVDWLTGSLPTLSSRCYSVPPDRLVLMSELLGAPILSALLLHGTHNYDFIKSTIATVQYNVAVYASWRTDSVIYTR